MFRKIKNLFIVEDIPEGKKENESPKEENFQNIKKEDKQIDIEEGQVSKRSLDKFLKVLADAMEAANLEGYDYLEFKQALRSLDDIEQDEEKRYITSYTLAQTMGAQKETLLKSAKYYIDVLKNEEKKFNESLQNQVNSKVHKKKETLKKLEAGKQHKLEQIKKLNEEIKVTDGKIDLVKKDITTSSNKVANVQKSFHTAFDLIVRQINDDVSKMDNYLK